jgi:hypothetical protein
MTDPVLYLGLDIATERDTTALSAVWFSPRERLYRLWGHRIWHPPVNIATQVLPTLTHLLTNYRVGKLCYDPFQFISEAQRLAAEGYEHLLRKVNQQGENPMFSNILQSVIQSGEYRFYANAERRNHYTWCVAHVASRGFHIKKNKQTKVIDQVIADAMALYGCVEDIQAHHHPTYDEDTHARSILALP